MSKNVYVAGPFVDKENAMQLARKLEAAGHTITHRWWNYEGLGEEHESEEFLRKCAYSDWHGVRDADVIVVWNTAKSEGKAVEQGIAIALGKSIIVLTPDKKPSSNVFHYLPNYIHTKTVEETLEHLNGL